MIVQSPVISQLGISVDGARPENGDSDIRLIPASFLNIEPVGLLQVTGVSAPAIRQSTTGELVRIHAPAAVSDVRALITIGKGLWEIYWWGVFQADFTEAIAATPGFGIQLGYKTFQIDLFTGNFVANVPMTFDRHFRVSIDTDLVLQMQLGATGAGQNARYHTSYVANRII